MKKIFLILTLIVIYNSAFSQSIIGTANSKSGILVGSTTDFAGISYENASDKFSFNYKLTKQDKDTANGNSYPHFWGVNFGTGIKVDKGKASLVSNEKWQGGVDFDFTLFRTWDKTTTKEIKESENGITHKTANINQKTLYIRLSDGFERFKSFESTIINSDTTFVILNNPLQNNFTGTIGFYTMYQLKTKWFFSYALSANLSSINNSTRKLSETNLTPFSGQLLNSKDSTQILQTAKQESYFSGKPEFELFFVPRADVFLRYRTGEKKPVVGLLFSYSPLVSSFESVKTRNCFAFGPTFGLDTFPDQVLFAIMNEFVQDKKGEYKYALTFQASFPIRFK
jgi:hypothetical protein